MNRAAPGGVPCAMKVLPGNHMSELCALRLRFGKDSAYPLAVMERR
jgi:hypothetical protein